MTPNPSAAPETSSAEATIDALFTALHARDDATARALFDDRIVYTNVGLSTLRGRKKMGQVIALLTGPLFGFRVYTLTSAVAAEAGDAGETVVLNERIDEITMGRLVVRFWVCGRFEVDGPVITRWSDYFDMVDIAKGFARGLLAVLVPRWNRAVPA